MGRNSALSLQPGRGTLPFTLADDPTIKVNIADFTAVKQGYEVSVRAVVLPNRQVVAGEVKVTLPEPPAGTKKKPAAKPDDKTPPESPKKANGKDAGLLQPVPEK